MSQRTLILTTTAGRVLSTSSAVATDVVRVTVGTPLISHWPEPERGTVRSALVTAAGGAVVDGLSLGSETGGARLALSAYPLRSNRGIVDSLLFVLDTRGPLAAQANAQSPDDVEHLREMTSVIAHEIRNPLAAVRSAIEVVARRLTAGSGDGLVVEQVLDRIDGLDALLDDLLMFAERPEPHLQPIDLAPLLAELVASLAGSRAARCQLAVRGAAPVVNADAGLLRTAFMHLLMNALQSQGDDDPVEVVLDTDTATVRVSIADRGPGFSDEARQALFRPFFTTKARGTGLGLPVARHLVQLHGGTVAVESSAAGALVTVTLPAVALVPVKVPRRSAN